MRGLKARTTGAWFNQELSPPRYFSYNDTGIDTDEALDDSETGIDCDADATTAIPAGSIIKIDTEFMFVTATGTTLTVVRPNPVAHDTNADIYKKVNNCVLWLPGQDDPQSATIRDRSGLNNHGTITGATWARTSSGLWYLNFDGTDDYINCGSDSSLRITGAITLMAWVNRQNDTLEANIMGKFGALAPNYAYRLIFASTNVLRFQTSVDGTAVVTSSSTATYTDAIWRLVTATFDGGNQYIYANETLVAGPNAQTSIHDNTTELFYIGMTTIGAIWDYLGYIALPRVFNRGLSSLEIRNIYQQEKSLFGV